MSTIMLTLRDILVLVNYNDNKKELEKNELYAWVKLLAYCGCFDKPNEEEKSEIEQSPRIKKLIREIFPIWKRIGLNESNPNYCNTIINDDETRRILEIPVFHSYKPAYEWLRDITQIHLLRKYFDREGLTREKEQAGLYPLQMLEEKTINIDEAKKADPHSIPHKLYQIANSLHLLDHEPWPTQCQVNHIVMLGHIDKYVHECVDFLHDFHGTLYYLTGPRGLFNQEESLAAILAEWYEMPEKVDIIQKVLDKHKSIKDSKQWTMDLTALKLEIMEALQVTYWPKAPQSYYWKDKDTFDKAADELKREHLDCLGGPWPVAMDMVAHRIKQRQMKCPGLFKNINLVQVVTKGRVQKLPSIDDTIQTWYDRYGHDLLEKNENPIFVACSLSHRLPYVVNTLLNKIAYVDALKKQALNNKIHRFIESKKSLFNKSHVEVIGPAAKELNMVMALDALAKLIFSMDKNIDNLIHEYELFRTLKIADIGDASQAALAIKMGHYNKYFNHLRLANSAFDLAESFCQEPTKNLFKAAGLFNFAINVLKSAKDDHLNAMIEDLYTCTIINMQSHIISSLTKLEREDKLADINWDVIKKIDLENRKKLFDIRKKLANKFNMLKDEHDKKLYKLYQDCFDKRSKFFLALIQQCLDILGQHPAQFEFACFGSNARMHATPYSDWEYMMLIDHDGEIPRLFSVELNKLFLLKILNLGETYLPALNIGGNFSEIFGYDKTTPVGFCFDAYTKKASMVPLGMEKNRLIGTPQEMTDMLAKPKNFEIHDYFQQSLRLSKIIRPTDQKNENCLFDEYKKCLKQDKNFKSLPYSLGLLKRDIEIFINEIQETLKLNKITHERYFYRPITAVMDDLYMLLNSVENIGSHKKFSLLEKYGIINKDERNFLEAILKTVLYLRFQMHLLYDRHEINFSNDNANLLAKVHLSLKELHRILVSMNNRWKKSDIELLKQEFNLANNVIKKMVIQQSKLFNKSSAESLGDRKKNPQVQIFKKITFNY